MCGSAPAPPAPIIMPPTNPDNSAQLNALTMQNQALQDQLNEMQQNQTAANATLSQQRISAERIREQQMAPDSRATSGSDELKRGKKGRASLRLRRKKTRTSGGVSMPGTTSASGSTGSKKTATKRGAPNLPKY